MADNKCARCSKTVYPQETIAVSGGKYHKLCFKCSVCSTQLNLNNFLGLNENGTYNVYCKVHAPKAGPKASVPSSPQQPRTNATPAPATGKIASSPFLKQDSAGQLNPPVQPSAAKKTAGAAPKVAANPVQTKTTAAPATKQAPTGTSKVASDAFKRPAEAASFLKRSRHKFDFQNKLSPQQLEDMKKLFALYDKDKKGIITIQQFAETLEKIGYSFSPANVVTIVRIVDENKDGVLNFEEFLGFYDFLDFLKNLFSSADKDGDGAIDRRELNVMLKRAGYKFTPSQVELMYRLVDEDGSGVLEISDFLSLMLFIIFAQILFATTDTDGNDSIDLREFNTLLDDLGILMPPDEVIEFFNELDTDKSGTLNFEEYIELVFELRYPIISTLVKIGIEATGGPSAELKEEVEISPDDHINLLEASGFLKRSRHRFDFESKITPDQISDFKKLFQLYDLDGSGTINVIELASVLFKLGYTFSPENVDVIIQIVDDNMDGVLNFKEFLAFYDFLEYLKSLFESADADGNGSIDRNELKTLLEKAGYNFNEKQTELFYKMCDEDGSGVLELADFFSLTLFIFWAQILFAKADTDGNDSIDLMEFNNALKRLGILMPPEGVANYFNELDKDGDGHLVFNEYIEVIFMVKFLDDLFGL